MRAIPLLLLLAVVGCGSEAPRPGPSPIPDPAPSPITVSVTITDTVTGAQVGTHVQSVNTLPAQVTVSHPGYVTRETWVSSATPTVNLFPDAGFDLTFYRQLARGALDGRMDALRVLRQAPAIYLQTHGLSAANVAALEAAARATVPALTGGRFQVLVWETGAEARAPRDGWITVDLVTEPTVNSCGRAELGASVGHVWLNVAPLCHHRGHAVHPPLFAHELGHALGFSHVRNDGALMTDIRNIWLSGAITPSERHHAALAYARQPGNEDIDRDGRTSGVSAPMVVVD